MAPQSYAGILLLDANARDVWPAFEMRGAVVVSETLAFKLELRRGDAIFLHTARGERAFPVAATFRSYDVNPGAVLMSRATYDAFWDDAGIDSLGIYLDRAADPLAVLEELRAQAGGSTGLLVRSNRELRRFSLQIFDRTFVITGVLYWLAVGVAIIGILGAMLALQMERARDMAVLRALGMTPAELGGMVTLQTAFIGVLSGLAALPLGLLMGWVLIEVINRRAFGWGMQIVVHSGALTSALALSVCAALVAGIYPAWRAAHSCPALAMREE
jgi:putative ABC transport system permease protein